MTMRIILPKIDADEDPGLPLFFLAGPVRGGGDWQRRMCIVLAEQLSNFYIAVPCRWSEEHPLYRYAVPKEQTHATWRQLDWERHYLEETAIGEGRIACVIFWLACESSEDPHPGPEPYAMDTRGELGEWRGRMIERRVHDKDRMPRVVIGAEDEFFGLDAIRRNFRIALEDPDFPFYDTMEKTAAAAISMAYGNQD